MKKVAIKEVSGAGLDWLVAKCEGKVYGLPGTIYEFRPSVKWSHGGPIIEREKVKISPNLNDTWSAQIRHTTPHPLVAHN